MRESRLISSELKPQYQVGASYRARVTNERRARAPEQSPRSCSTEHWEYESVFDSQEGVFSFMGEINLFYVVEENCRKNGS